jgi:hypothetical protein
MSAEIKGKTYYLRSEGIRFRWYREDGRPTRIIGQSEQEARRALMFAGTSL